MYDHFDGEFGADHQRVRGRRDEELQLGALVAAERLLAALAGARLGLELGPALEPGLLELVAAGIGGGRGGRDVRILDQVGAVGKRF